MEVILYNLCDRQTVILMSSDKIDLLKAGELRAFYSHKSRLMGYKSAFIIVGFPTFTSSHKYLVDNDSSTIIYLKKHAFFGCCSSK